MERRVKEPSGEIVAAEDEVWAQKQMQREDIFGLKILIWKAETSRSGGLMPIIPALWNYNSIMGGWGFQVC